MVAVAWLQARWARAGLVWGADRKRRLWSVMLEQVHTKLQLSRFQFVHIKRDFRLFPLLPFPPDIQLPQVGLSLKNIIEREQTRTGLVLYSIQESLILHIPLTQAHSSALPSISLFGARDNIPNTPQDAQTRKIFGESPTSHQYPSQF